MIHTVLRTARRILVVYGANIRADGGAWGKMDEIFKKQRDQRIIV